VREALQLRRHGAHRRRSVRSVRLIMSWRMRS